MYTIKLEKVMTLLIFLLTLTWGSFVSCEESDIKKHILELGNHLNPILVEEGMCKNAANCLNKDFLFVESIPEGIGVTLYGMQNKATATKKIIKECNEMFFGVNRSITIHLLAYEATKEQVSQIYSKPYMTLRFDEPTQEKKSEDDKKAEIYALILNSIVGAASDPKNQERFLDYISGGTLYSEEEKLKRRKESQKHRHLVKEQRENLSQRLHLIFKTFQECNQPDKCELTSSRNQKKNERIVFVLHRVENPSLIEKVMEECVSTFLNLNGQVNIHLAIRDGATKDEDAIRLAERRPYITLSLKGAE